MANTFKHGDIITDWKGDRHTVQYISGPYVYYDNGNSSHYENCALVSQTVRDFIKAGKMIDAIKLHRSNTGLRLKEAKDYCEAMRADMNHNPERHVTLGDILATALKPKFKAGDRVRLTAPYDDIPGTFERYNHYSDDKAYVNWDNGVGNDLPFPISKLVLIPSVAAIVARNINGTYQPSMKPMIHGSVEAATKEAQRLAIKHPGVEFGTFVLASRTTAPAPVATTVTVAA